MGRILKILKKYYQLIFIFIFIMLLMFPYLNSLTHIIKDVTLSGVSLENIKPIYSVKDYLNGTYQGQFDNYYLERFPYRNVAIKNYNQLRYSLFNEGSVIIGKDNYLFEEWYINEYLGIDVTISEEKVKMIINDLNKINNICKKNGKEFYIIITPSKAEFFSEYIPNKYYQLASQNENYIRYYDLIINKLQNSDIKYFDSVKYLKENKIDEPIFYKTGTHWSFVASTYALSDFVRYINATSDLRLRNFNVIGSEKSPEGFYIEDDDIYRVLNIYNGEKDENYYKPIIEFENNNKVNKKLFMQGGSFSWNLIEYLKRDLFNTIDFGFYEQFIRNYNNEGEHSQVSIQNNKITKEYLDLLLQDKDVILLEVNQEYMSKWVDSFPKILREYLEEYGFPKNNN